MQLSGSGNKSNKNKLKTLLLSSRLPSHGSQMAVNTSRQNLIPMMTMGYGHSYIDSSAVAICNQEAGDNRIIMQALK